MALHPEAFRNSTARHPKLRVLQEARVRRLSWLALAVAVLLGVYVGALSWVTQQVEAGVERSIQPLPLVLRDRPDSD